MIARRPLLAAFAALPIAAPLALGGCSALRPQRPTAGPVRQWSGRMSLQVEGEARQSFSAGFELRGSPAAGTLELTTPLGGTAALLEWSSDGARLRVPGEPVRSASSLDELARQALGTPVPVAALFDWLDGRPTEALGWQADLSRQASGRLQARRLQPPAELRLVFDTP